MKTALLALSLLIGSAAAAQDIAFPDAVRDYQAGRWSAAYGRFTSLANAGDPDAARVALFMYRNGPLLYRTHWDASEDDIELWTRLAAKGGRKEPVFTPVAQAHAQAGVGRPAAAATKAR